MSSPIITAEFSKLRHIKSINYCFLVSLLVLWLLSAIIFGLSKFPQELYASQWGYRLGVIFFAVGSLLYMTREIEQHSIRYSLIATPNRRKLYFSRLYLVSAAGAIIGFLGGTGAWLIAVALQRDSSINLGLQSPSDIQTVFGSTLVYPIAGIIGMSVGVFVKRSAPGVALLFLWPLALELILTGIPIIGPVAENVLPFRVADTFIMKDSYLGLPSIIGLIYFGAVASIMCGIAYRDFTRRDF